MQQNPYFSITTPTFNHAQTLERTIKSVLSQGFSDYEYIIVDGGSTDNTIEIIKAYEPFFKGRLIWVSEKDDGIYDAINKAINLSRGEFLWNVNSDDFIEKDSLLNLYRFIKKDDNEYVVVGQMRIVDENGKELYTSSINENTIGKTYRKDWMIPHPSTVIPRSVYEKYGLYDTRFRIMADMDWFHRIYEAGVKFKCMDSILTNFSMGGVSTVSNYKRQSQDRWLYYSKNYPSKISSCLKFLFWHKQFVKDLFFH